MKQVGRIYGDTVWGTIRFVSSEYFPGQYVLVKDEYNNNCSLAAVYRIVECKSKNKYLESPEIILYLKEGDNVEDETIFTYIATFTSSVHDGKVSAERFPLYPGKKVYEADSESISIAYGIKADGSCVGHLLNSPESKINLSLDDIFNPHLMIVGKTGAGKSYFAKGLLRIMEREKYMVLAFAPSDEYTNADSDANSGLSVLEGDKLVLDYNLNTMSYLWGLTATEERLLAGVDLDKSKMYSSAELADEIITRFEQQTAETQINIFADEMQKGIVNKAPIPSNLSGLITKIKKKHLLFSLNKKQVSKLNKSYIINMGECSQSEQECILHFFLHRLLTMQKSTSTEKRKKVVVLIEEAHNYVPSVRSTLCKEVIVRIAREGRKYGISLCLITQRPVHFDQTALSQAGNKIIFSLPHPDDVKRVLEDVAHYSDDLTEIIKRQDVGQCTVNGDAYRNVLSFKVSFPE